MNWTPQLPRAAVGTETFCKEAKGVELSQTALYAQGPLSPDSHRPRRFRTRSYCGGRTQRAEGARKRPQTSHLPRRGD